MNFRIGLLVFFTSIYTLPLFAQDAVMPTPPISTSTVNTNASSMYISPGRYNASVLPAINFGMGKRLEKAFSSVSGLDNVEANSTDSSVHFSVKNGSKIRTADLQKLVSKIDSGAVMSAPILEHSMAATPGL